MIPMNVVDIFYEKADVEIENLVKARNLAGYRLVGPVQVAQAGTYGDRRTFVLTWEKAPRQEIEA